LIVCIQLATSPLVAVAVHVRAIVNSCAHEPGVTTSLKVSDTVPQSGFAENVAVPVLDGADD
jgi:hypothetical protein